MGILQQYLEKLKENFNEEDRTQFSLTFGASEVAISKLKAVYPDCPETLIGLLKTVDGTHYRLYGDKKVCIFMLNSDVEEGEYPYYLESVEQILEESHFEDSICDIYGEEDVTEYEIASSDIDIQVPRGKRLCFSQCMNNGGTSQLYIDFEPTEHGIKGQIIRYLHDPDEYRVIARNFDEYLESVVESGFIFLKDDSDC